LGLLALLRNVTAMTDGWGTVQSKVVMTDHHLIIVLLPHGRQEAGFPCIVALLVL
jgi:hypothetical protein